MSPFVLAVARRSNATAVLVFDGTRIFDVDRLRETRSDVLGRKIRRLAGFYGAERIVIEDGAAPRLGLDPLAETITAIGKDEAARAIMPGYERGDGPRLHAYLVSRYGELVRFLALGRRTGLPLTSRAPTGAVLAAATLGLAHAILTPHPHDHAEDSPPS